ncbi:hypothetical protein [Calothrix sp. PCC 7507]|uniref:hypothetical protein n=1 Tax=Calothrix sp. PCC 7507 TaxID=99598 RepID=UPI00029F3ADC|nr:hypothetical protein [Calothrix sp. PCC 7507]AFY31110.1 hypothetical protein Cal7507_0621 [Calothrix sp. PCC 7507]
MTDQNTVATNKSSIKKAMIKNLSLAITGATLLVTSSAIFSRPALADRSTCVQNIARGAYQQAGGRRNVMVFNLNQSYSHGLVGDDFRRATCDGIPFGVWTFSSGTFTNRGDGGYINWTFIGNFRRTGHQGGTVVFSPIR